MIRQVRTAYLNSIHMTHTMAPKFFNLHQFQQFIHYNVLLTYYLYTINNTLTSQSIFKIIHVWTIKNDKKCMKFPFCHPGS